MRCKFRQYLGDQLSVIVSRMGMLLLRESKCHKSDSAVSRGVSAEHFQWLGDSTMT